MHNILEALSWRYAVKIFDPSKKVSAEDLHTILESGRLAPSSLGLEPWKFILVENPEVRAKLREASYGQPKVTDASHLLVLAYRTDGRVLGTELLHRASEQEGVPMESLDGLKAMVEGAITGRSDADLAAWLRAQCYIPLGMMLETAALLHVDAGPMEGFDAKRVDEILGLSEKHLASTAMLALGYRGDDPAARRAKVRRTMDDVLEEVK